MGARIIAMRRIVERYEKMDDARTRRACNFARARLDTAEAELLRTSSNYASAAAAHFRAYLRSAESRYARAAISDVSLALFTR